MPPFPEQLKLSVLAVSLSTGTFVGGLFGMNLLSGLEATPGLFYAVSGSACAIAYVAYTTLYARSPTHRSNSSAGNRLASVQQLLRRLDNRAIRAKLALQAAQHDKDTMDDKLVSKEEFKELYEQLFNTVISVQDTDVLFDVFDLDHDGYVTQDELTMALESDVLPSLHADRLP